MDPQPDLYYYEALGVDFDAKPRGIVSAYRKAALQCHPDRNPNNVEIAAKLERIQAAFETLSVPERRNIYDKLISGTVHNRYNRAIGPDRLPGLTCGTIAPPTLEVSFFERNGVEYYFTTNGPESQMPTPPTREEIDAHFIRDEAKDMDPTDVWREAFQTKQKELNDDRYIEKDLIHVFSRVTANKEWNISTTKEIDLKKIPVIIRFIEPDVSKPDSVSYVFITQLRDA